MGRMVLGSAESQKPRMRLLLAGIATALCVHVLAPEASAAPKAFSNPGKDCFRNPADLLDLDESAADSNPVRQALKCDATSARGTLQQLSFAQFHAAKANRIIAESSLARPENLANAERLFRSAAGNSTLALVELARVNRLQRKYDEAQTVLTGLDRNDPNVQFEQAMTSLGALDQPGVRLSPEAEQTQRTTALNLLRNNLRSPVAYVRRRAPIELADLSTKLGAKALQSTSDVSANAGYALNYFDDAKQAVEVLREQQRMDDFRKYAPRVYFSLGRANLRAAGFARSPGDVNAECAAPPVGPRQGAGPGEGQIAAADGDFRDALAVAPTADALWGAGCVKLMRGDNAGAAADFRAALSRAGELQDVKRWEVLRSLGWAQTDLTQAAASFKAAIEDNPRPPDAALIRLRIDLAKRYNDANSPEKAHEALNALLIGGQFPVGAAYLQRALIWFPDLDPEVAARRGQQTLLLDAPVSIGPNKLKDVGPARLALQMASRMKAEPPGQASFYLSRLEQSAPAGATAAQTAKALATVRAADEAIIAGATQPAYRKQACLMRIKFWEALPQKQRDEGALQCTPNTASSDPTNMAEQLLFQGLFNLRGTFFPARGGDQQRAWANALSSFRFGLNQLGPPVIGESPQRAALRGRLARGLNDAIVCSGLGPALGAIEVPDIESQQQAAADAFFAEFGLRECSARRP